MVTAVNVNANSNGMEVQLSPRQLVRQGMDRFRGGDIAGSIDSFDLADRAVPDGSLRPFLWQRGISYYYANQFEKGSQQVSTDHMLIQMKYLSLSNKYHKNIWHFHPFFLGRCNNEILNFSIVPVWCQGKPIGTFHKNKDNRAAKSPWLL
jgi:hypothetical protein